MVYSRRNSVPDISNLTSASIRMHRNKKFVSSFLFLVYVIFQIFQKIGASVLDSLLVIGQNCSVVAYGQTGSGKTFTMLGESVSANLFRFEICLGCFIFTCRMQGLTPKSDQIWPSFVPKPHPI